LEKSDPSQTVLALLPDLFESNCLMKVLLYFLLFLCACAKFSAHKEAKRKESIIYGYGVSQVLRSPSSQPWYDILPSCPCLEPKEEDTWTKSNGGLHRYHRGASNSYRSTAFFTTVPHTKHSQQCTYDKQHRLITGGWAAGTPDVVNPLFDRQTHRTVDVMTWEYITDGGKDAKGLAIYHQYWPPNQGEGCQVNILP
jgi:hypothetical protein